MGCHMQVGGVAICLFHFCGTICSGDLCIF